MAGRKVISAMGKNREVKEAWGHRPGAEGQLRAWNPEPGWVTLQLLS